MDPDIKSLPLGVAELLRDGEDAAIVALGPLVHTALEAASELSAHGISCAVLNARFAKPLDEARILDLARRCGSLRVVEEHSAMAGFGSAVLEVLAHHGASPRVRCLGIPDRLVEHGDPNVLRSSFGLDVKGLVSGVLELVER